MIRNIYLEGEMGEKFGTHFQFNAPTVRDALKCLESNFPSFKGYLIASHEKSVGFVIDVADNTLDYIEECIMDLNVGDITITPVPAGSKSGAAKILAAIAMVALIIANPGLLLYTPATGTAGTAGFVAATLTTKGMVVAALSLNLAMMGLTQMMAPDPATDQDQEQSYLFNGAESNTVQGDPVPVLYGLLRVPGQPISFEIAGVNSRINTLGFGRSGGAYGTSVVAG
jgi:predicted phage tail protein